MQIDKLVNNQTYSGLVTIMLIVMIAISINKPDPDLKQRVSDLEKRVASIEETLSKTDTTVIIERGENYRENWRKLREGMSENQVTELLGRPHRIDGGSSAIWHYPGGGRVHFSRGRVNRWSEPY